MPPARSERPATPRSSAWEVDADVNAFLGGVLLHAPRRAGGGTRAARWPHDKLQDPPQLSRGGASRPRHRRSHLAAAVPSLHIMVFRFAFLQESALLNGRSRSTTTRSCGASCRAYRRRTTPLQAPLVLRQLARIDEHMRERVERARAYHAGLREVREAMVAPLRTVSPTCTPTPDPGRRPQALLRRLMRRRRDVAGQHIKSCADFAASPHGITIARCAQDGRRGDDAAGPIRATRCATSKPTCA